MTVTLLLVDNTAHNHGDLDETSIQEQSIRNNNNNNNNEFCATIQGTNDKEKTSFAASMASDGAITGSMFPCFLQERKV